MTVEEMREEKKKRGYSYGMIADLAGIPVSTVQKIFTGVTDAPRYDTLQALERVFRGSPFCLREEAAYERAAEEASGYTLRDYYELPEERRVELIDGEFYDMSAPSLIHQDVGGELYRQISNFIRQNQGDCKVFLSPVDVQLDRDDRTMLEPDLVLLCDRSKIIRRCVYGAPDFVVEILSPDSKRRDAIIKLRKYQEAGVREYWMIDPDKLRLIIYRFEEDETPVCIQNLEGRVDLGIFHGRLQIDLDMLREIVLEINELDEVNNSRE
ncbi:MAG: Uma2 family endonuclease [Roseburia sp.]|nr:Uma2 family endonuclease [Roseburia sp.]